MRAFVAAALLATACASVPLPPPERVHGCWINRTDFAVTTMRWLPDAARGGLLTGQWLNYRRNGTTEARRYTLEPRDGAWALCLQADAPTCWQVAEGESGSLEGGRAFIDAGRESLRISVLTEAREDVIFAGARDGCD